MITPIKTFKAVLPGSAYPQTVDAETEIAADSIAAKAAFDLGCLSAEDRRIVAAAQGLADSQTKVTDGKASAQKARGAAPENKMAGDKS